MELQPVRLDWASVFANPAGKAILDYLSDVFWITSPMYAPGIPTELVIFREGQRSVLLSILDTVDAAINHPTEVQGTYDPGQLQEEDHA